MDGRPALRAGWHNPRPGAMSAHQDNSQVVAAFMNGHHVSVALKPSKRKRDPRSMSVKQMSNSTASIVNIGSAVGVVAAVLAFWVAANAQSMRLADSISEVRSTITSVRDAQRSTRDAVMMLSGKVEVLAVSAERTTDFLDTLDERIRALETKQSR